MCNLRALDLPDLGNAHLEQRFLDLWLNRVGKIAVSQETILIKFQNSLFKLTFIQCSTEI